MTGHLSIKSHACQTPDCPAMTCMCMCVWQGRVIGGAGLVSSSWFGEAHLCWLGSGSEALGLQQGSIMRMLIFSWEVMSRRKKKVKKSVMGVSALFIYGGHNLQENVLHQHKEKAMSVIGDTECCVRAQRIHQRYEIVKARHLCGSAQLTVCLPRPMKCVFFKIPYVISGGYELQFRSTEEINVCCWAMRNWSKTFVGILDWSARILAPLQYNASKSTSGKKKRKGFKTTTSLSCTWTLKWILSCQCVCVVQAHGSKRAVLARWPVGADPNLAGCPVTDGDISRRFGAALCWLGGASVQRQMRWWWWEVAAGFVRLLIATVVCSNRFETQQQLSLSLYRHPSTTTTATTPRAWFFLIPRVHRMRAVGQVLAAV